MQPTPSSLAWALPFAGLLASMAVLPVVAPRFWHRRMGLVATVWCLALLLPLPFAIGLAGTGIALWHAMVVEYLPFVSMLLALYTTGGGVLLRGGPAGTPLGNTAMLGLGMAMGVVMGTTGASMVLIHPLLRANAHRRRKVHLVLFLIVLVANASGALTPLGNPPLYIGLLHGVPLFWPARHLALPLLVVTLVLLTAFLLLDRYLAASEPPPPPAEPVHIRGWLNIGLILVVVAAVLAQGMIAMPPVVLLGEHIETGRLALVALFAAITAASAWLTPRAIRQANDFSWEPAAEVAKLFAAIFITIAPVVAMLRAGPAGPLAFLLPEPAPFAYFWLSGIASALLDNAPTYLMFFELAGVRADALSGPPAVMLAAISAGAVFFGGLTYIGNAPNMMLRAIAAHRGVRMPSFFTFTLFASAALLPALVAVGLLFFR